jgi:esterase/lipase superfamily enzyme
MRVGQSRSGFFACVPGIALCALLALSAGPRKLPPLINPVLPGSALELRLTISAQAIQPAPESVFVRLLDAHGQALLIRSLPFSTDITVPIDASVRGATRLVVFDDRDRRSVTPIELAASERDGAGRIERRVSLVEPTRTREKLPPSPEDWQKVFFATDRAERAGSSDPAQRFGAERSQHSDVLSYGVCWASFPHDPRIGENDARSWRRIQFHVDQARHGLRGLTVTPRDSFCAALDDELRQRPGSKLLIFVPGYNVTFEGAVLRTAQLAYDIELPGAAVLFSWPSRGQAQAYAADEATSEWSVPHFESFLETLTERTSVRTIEIIAHSMGSRVVTSALAHLRERGRIPQAVEVNELVLAAADLDAGLFRRFATEERGVARRITLYASSNDPAIAASRQVHRAPRAGDGGAHLEVVPGVETIDASAITTDFIDHAGFTDGRSVITDLRDVLRGRSVKDRCCLRPATKDGLPYWVFRP